MISARLEAIPKFDGYAYPTKTKTAVCDLHPQ